MAVPQSVHRCIGNRFSSITIAGYHQSTAIDCHCKYQYSSKQDVIDWKKERERERGREIIQRSPHHSLVSDEHHLVFPQHALLQSRVHLAVFELRDPTV